jgi:hypothetical protein
MVSISDSDTARPAQPLCGVYGDKNLGNPVLYDHLKLVSADDNTDEIARFTTRITLVMSNYERVLRIHRILCKPDKD